MASSNNIHKKIPQPPLIIFTLIILLSIFTNYYHLEKTHNFEWDQDRDATEVYTNIIQQKKPTLIGPRVVGPEGFFVGPLHYYILTPFYALAHGDPIAALIAAGLIGVMTTATYTYIARKLFNNTAAIYAGTISALMPQLVAWNVMYMPLLTILMYFALHNILEKHRLNLNIPLAFLLFGLALQAHFSAAFLGIELLIALGLVMAKKPSPQLFQLLQWRPLLKPIFIGICIFSVTFAPLILFDIRHDFLNTKLFFSFFTKNSEKTLDITRAFIIFIRNPNIFAFMNNKTALATINIIFAMITLGAGWRLYRKTNDSKHNHLILLLTWILIPFITLTFYSGTISEYYFVTITALVPLFIGVFASQLPAVIMQKNRNQAYARISQVALIAFFTIAILANVQQALHRDSLTSLFYKKAVIKYIADQKDPFFSLNYNVPLGQGYGFTYLLHYYGIKQDDSKPIPKYVIRIEPAPRNNYLPEKEFGVFKVSKVTRAL